MRAIVLTVLLTLLVVAPPLAAAADSCMAMSSVCELPCGTASCTTVIRVPGAILSLTTDVIAPRSPDVPNVAPSLPERPPRPHLLRA